MLSLGNAPAVALQCQTTHLRSIGVYPCVPKCAPDTQLFPWRKGVVTPIPIAPQCTGLTAAEVDLRRASNDEGCKHVMAHT